MARNRGEVNLSRILAEIPTSLKLDFERKISLESSKRGNKIYIYQKLIEMICEYTYGNETDDPLVNELLNTSKESVYKDVVEHLSSKQNTEIVVEEKDNGKGGKTVSFGGFSKLQK